MITCRHVGSWTACSLAGAEGSQQILLSQPFDHNDDNESDDDNGEELDDDILICGLKVKNLSLEDISKIFKENFNAFKKLKIGDTKNINLLKSVKKTNSPYILTQINNCSMLTIWLITNS